MSTLNEKTTIYLNPQVKKFIRYKAVAEDRSMSEIINEYFADMLEDIVDKKAVDKRRSEPTISFQDMIQDLGITNEQIQG